jgi:hypothetical protein
VTARAGQWMVAIGAPVPAGAGQRGAQHDPAAGALGDPRGRGHAAPARRVVAGGAGRADLDDDPAGRLGAAGHLDPRPGWIAVTWSTTSETMCSSSIAAPGSTVALGPLRTSTRIGSSVASTASSSSADSRAGAPGRGPASMPASSISVSASWRIRRAVSISSGSRAARGERVGPHAVHQAHVAVDPLPQPTQHVGGHVTVARAVPQAITRGAARDATATVLASGRALAPDVHRVTLGREHVVAHHRSSRVGFGRGEPAPLGRRMPGRRPPVLVCKVPGSTHNPPSHRR